MDNQDMTIYLKDYRPTPYAIDQTFLEFDLHPAETEIRAQLHFSVRGGTQPGTALELVGEELKLRKIAIDGRILQEREYHADADRLCVYEPPSSPFILDIVTQICPEKNRQLSGLYLSSKIYCTQCEAEGFRRITYYYDRPDVLSVFTVNIKADRESAPVILSNGNLIETGDVPGNAHRHFAIWHDPHPKPSYLFALVAGNLASISDEFTTSSGREVKLGIYVEPGKEARCDFAMESLKAAMRWDETAFGREYDLDLFNIVAVSDFNMGAMENKGLNVFNDKYLLASPEYTGDGGYIGVESVIAHEYLHNWTGNRITCRDWFQLSLKEGLTIFRDQEFTSDQRVRSVKRISDVATLRLTQFKEDAGPLAHPVRPSHYKEINNFYTHTIYLKGAELIRMLKIMIGKEHFAAGMALYFERYDGMAATVENFLDCFAKTSNRDLSQFMRWYEQAGTPQVDVKSRYDGAARTLHLDLAQKIAPMPGQSTAEPVPIPIRFGLLTLAGGQAKYGAITGIESHDDVLIMNQNRHKVMITDVAEPVVISLFRDFSAPVIVNSDQDDDTLGLLARHDSDLFNRFNAIRALTLRALEAHITGDGKAGDLFARVNEIVGDLAADESLSPAYRACCLTPPHLSEIAQHIGADIDPEAIYSASEALTHAIAAQHAARFADILASVTIDEPYRPSPEQIGARSLQSLLYYFLVRHPEPGRRSQIGDEILERLKRAETMAVRAQALSVLVTAELEQAGQALALYFDHYRHDRLSLDKWFDVQARLPSADTLERVKSLSAHEDFTFDNPNRVYALIGAFALGNFRQFNRADGAGYQFLADCILRIDPANPQLAARLATAFNALGMLEPGRRDKAREALCQIADSEHLSRNCEDIVERILQ